MDTIVLKAEAFRELAVARGHTTYDDQAAATGLGVGTLHRLRNGGPAGPTAIARICTTYGARFEDVFEFSAVAPAVRPKAREHRRVKAVA